MSKFKIKYNRRGVDTPIEDLTIQNNANIIQDIKQDPDDQDEEKDAKPHIVSNNFIERMNSTK